MIISKHQVEADLREFQIGGICLKAPVYHFNTVIVGSGAAGLNCADLIAAGAADGQTAALITEGMKMARCPAFGTKSQPSVAGAIWKGGAAE